MEIKRIKTKQINVGGVLIGGDSRITTQSMCTTRTADVEKTVAQILELEKAKCDIVRVAVLDSDDARAIEKIKAKVSIPIVADIHFDYKLALLCGECGVDKIRINPGNIGDEQNVKMVAKMCDLQKIPIRIGVNSGSIEKHILEKYQRPTPQGMVESALYHVALLNKFDFDDIAISIKASNVVDTIVGYRILAEHVDYPLHLGVTEAGTYEMGVIKSSVALGSLLCDGIGDTIRVSLTDDPVKEVISARNILKGCGILKDGISFVSCPTCGRCKIDLINLAKGTEIALKDCNKNIKVAIMGCAVNGPGEAREADIGVAGGNGEGIIFAKGKIIKKVKYDDILSSLVEEIEKI